MEPRITIITLGVADVARATFFYESIFGWTKSSHSNEHISFFELNDLQLALYGKTDLAEDAQVPASGTGFNAFTLAYNTRSEAEVDELIQTMRAKGVKIVKEPQKVSWGGYSSYLADPDGHLWEIAYNPYLTIK